MNKNTALILFGIIAVLGIIAIIWMFTAENTGAFPLVKIQGRPRPGDMDYQGAQPYTNTPRNMPAAEAYPQNQQTLNNYPY